MKVLGVLAIVLLLTAVAADVVAKEVAQNRIADQVEDSIEGVDEVDTEIGGFPFLPKLLSGRISELQLGIPRVRTRALVVSDLELNLEGLEFDPVDAFAGSGDIRVEGGSGHAYATAAALTRALRRSGIDASLAFRGAAAEISAAGRTQRVGSVRIRDGELFFEVPTGPFSLDIPATFDSVRYESARVEEGRLRIEIELSRKRLEL